MVHPINHYSMQNIPSIYDEEALTALELAARCAGKVNECVQEFNRHTDTVSHHLTEQDKKIDKLFGDEMKDHVHSWLDEHPEATTTVQDGSLTLDKLAPGELGFMSVAQFGATGDGDTDDSDAIQAALTFCGENGLKTVFEYGKTYRVSKQVSVTGPVDFNCCTILPDENAANTLFYIQGGGTRETFSQAVLGKYGVTEKELFSKSFFIVSPLHMGARYENPAEHGYTYYEQAMQTDENGDFINDCFHADIVEGEYEFRDIQDVNKPVITVENVHFDLKERKHSPLTLIYCHRSNTRIQNVSVTGLFDAGVTNDDLFVCRGSANVEFSHIHGSNPFPTSNSGYVFGLYESSDLYIHDCVIGGHDDKWGAIGSNFISNVVFERVKINRVDSHDMYHGHLIMRDCILHEVAVEGGNGLVLVENCTILRGHKQGILTLRTDFRAMPSGKVIYRNCRFFDVNYVLFYVDLNNTPSYDPATLGYTGTELVIDDCEVDGADLSQVARCLISEAWDDKVTIRVHNCKNVPNLGVYTTEAGKLSMVDIDRCSTRKYANITGAHRYLFTNNDCASFSLWSGPRYSIVKNNIINAEVKCQVNGSFIVVKDNAVMADVNLELGSGVNRYVINDNLLVTATHNNVNNWNKGTVQAVKA